MFLLRLELMGKAGGKGGAEFFLKNANLYKFNQQHRRYFSLNLVIQLLQTSINQYNLVLQIWPTVTVAN